jgi:DNA-binding MarR family transcriptional regulator
MIYIDCDRDECTGTIHMSIDWSKFSQFAIPEDSPGFLLWQVTHLWQRYVESALMELDITHRQFVLLAGIGWLKSEGNTVTQVQVADFCKIDAMLVSQVVRKLEQKQLVQRLPHPTDTRAKALDLTVDGKQVLAQALPLIEKLDAQFFKCGDRSILLAELTNLYRSVN